jgi:hypothetical protein
MDKIIKQIISRLREGLVNEKDLDFLENYIMALEAQNRAK